METYFDIGAFLKTLITPCKMKLETRLMSCWTRKEFYFHYIKLTNFRKNAFDFLSGPEFGQKTRFLRKYASFPEL